jgi:hypothetical protein
VRDVLFVAAILAFFVLAALLIVGCDRIIGPDPPPGQLDEADEADEAVAE